MAFLAERPMIGDEAHLEIDVVGHIAQHHRRDRADDAERHDQHDRERDRPAFVETCQKQEDEKDRQAEEDRRLAAGGDFLQRLAGPFEAEALGKLRREAFHFGDCRTEDWPGAGAPEMRTVG